MSDFFGFDGLTQEEFHEIYERCHGCGHDLDVFSRPRSHPTSICDYCLADGFSLQDAIPCVDWGI
jgi:hypothetical protein